MNKEDIYTQAVRFRRHLHAHPEVSGKEIQTQAFITSVLDHNRISYQKYETGIIATIGHGTRCVALRADMDALPVCEETGLEYASVNEGIMHACGHDMHMAMLLGAALVLKSCETELNGVVKLIFQPSEERRPGGARLLLPHVMETPVPLAIFGQHICPELPVGTIGIRPGAFFASSDNIIFAVEGKGTHAAMPHLGADPILAATALIQYYQTILTKCKDPFLPAVLSITSIHGGSANNVIPDRVEVLGTVRTHNDTLRHHIFDLIAQHSPAICELYGCRFVPDMPWNGLPPLVNNLQLTEQIITIAQNVGAKVIQPAPLTLGEDFAIYLQSLPGAFWTLGVCPPENECMPPLHNPQMSPDERAIPVGIDMLARTARHFME